MESADDSFMFSTYNPTLTACLVLTSISSHIHATLRRLPLPHWPFALLAHPPS